LIRVLSDLEVDCFLSCNGRVHMILGFPSSYCRKPVSLFQAIPVAASSFGLWSFTVTGRS
jgi:hypothetical protein